LISDISMTGSERIVEQSGYASDNCNIR
jgi:hypothetical protein